MPRLRPALTALLLALSVACAHHRGQEAPVTFAVGTPEAALVRRLQSDLRNLATAQAAFFATHQQYAAAFAEFDGMYRTSSGVTIWLPYASQTGWVARARLDELPGVECRIQAGTVVVPADWTVPLQEGVPNCVRLAPAAR